MAQYGEYGGPIKQYLGEEEITALNGDNVSTAISGTNTNTSNYTITLIITTSGNANIEIGAAATANSFPLTSSDTLVAKIVNGGTLGVWGDSGTPTVTVQKVIC